MRNTLFLLWGYDKFYFYFQPSTLWSYKRILCFACCHLIYRAFQGEWYSSHLTAITLRPMWLALASEIWAEVPLVSGEKPSGLKCLCQIFVLFACFSLCHENSTNMQRPIFQLGSQNEENIPWRNAADPWSTCIVNEERAFVVISHWGLGFFVPTGLITPDWCTDLYFPFE